MATLKDSVFHTIATLPTPRDFLPEADLDDPMPVPAIYLLCQGSRVVYIGQTNNLQRRLHEHRTEGRRPFDNASYWVCYNGSERLRIEAILILATAPGLNRAVNVGLKLDGTCYDLTKAAFAGLPKARRSKGRKARAIKSRAKKGVG